MLSSRNIDDECEQRDAFQVSDCIKGKLQSKGVDSVKSRVTNLVDYIPDLTLEALKKSTS